MKNLITKIELLAVVGLLFLVIFMSSCEEDEVCNCEYVNYDDGVETYRSSWDASCYNEVLDESVYTYSDGTKSYSRTEIQCK